MSSKSNNVDNLDTRPTVPQPPPIPDVSKFSLINFSQQPKGRRYLKELQFKLVGAIESNNTYEVAKIIRQGVDVNCIILIHKTPLIYSIEHRSMNPEIPDLLLEAGANVDSSEAVARGRRPLHVAVMTGSLILVKNLLKHHANIYGLDGSNMTALHYAAYYGFQDIASELLKRAPDRLIHYKDVSGRTALHRALESKHYDVAELLYQNGAKMNVYDNNGWTPLFQCLVFNDIIGVKYLLNRHIEVNTRDINGNTPLHTACHPLNRDLIRIVSGSSMDYYKRTRRIPTPELQSLFLHEKIGCLKTVKILVNAGADIAAVNNSGANAIQSARVPEIVIYLLACGTRLNLDTLMVQSQAVENDFWELIRNSKAYLEQTCVMKQCRAVIRQNVAWTRDIEKSVLALPLPQKLINYILLKDYDG